MDRVQTAAAVLHYAEGTLGPADFHPNGCASCARAVQLVDQVDQTYPPDSSPESELTVSVVLNLRDGKLNLLDGVTLDSAAMIVSTYAKGTDALNLRGANGVTTRHAASDITSVMISRSPWGVPSNL